MFDGKYIRKSAYSLLRCCAEKWARTFIQHPLFQTSRLIGDGPSYMWVIVEVTDFYRITIVGPSSSYPWIEKCHNHNNKRITAKSYGLMDFRAQPVRPYYHYLRYLVRCVGMVVQAITTTN